MANFENAKVGDKVYSLKYGEGEIHHLNDSSYCINCLFKENGSGSFTNKGLSHIGNQTADLYWSKPEIIEQKRLVTKTIEATIKDVVYFDKHTSFLIHSDVNISAGKIQPKITITYQIEE